MNIKYYMRGVGTGVIVTAMIFLAFDKPKGLTDAEIKLRAAALGMVEEKSLSAEADAIAAEADKKEREQKDEVSNTNNTNNQETVSGAEEQSVQEVAVAAENEDIDNDLESEEEVKEMNHEDPQLSEEKDDGTNESAEEEEREFVSLIVETGDVARAVSTKLYEAGLIESVEEYSNFLSGNSYSYRIRAGEYQIPVGADYQEIANILCKLPQE